MTYLIRYFDFKSGTVQEITGPFSRFYRAIHRLERRRCQLIFVTWA